MMTDKRREDLQRRINIMKGFGSLAGATILEIGADWWGFAAQMLVDAGAAKIISTNYTKNWPTETRGVLEKRKADARKLEESVEPQSIDIVFGVAVLEHIDGLKEFFASAKAVLKPGGLFFVHGGPIWSSGGGHHVFVNGETRKYRFGDRANNPILNWSHLIHTKQSLIDDLVARNISAGDAEKIGHWVYEGDGINRVGFRTMCETYAACGLEEIDRQINAFAGPSNELLDAIEGGPYGGQERYDVTGVTFAGRA